MSLSFPTFLRKFWSRVEKRSDGCWVWIGKLNHSGYGIATYQGSRGAHRLSWMFHKGPIPSGVFVCHKCDNPACINPDHLFLGTPADNTADMMNKGRFTPPAGESSGTARLSAAQVREIRASNRPRKELAAAYGVTERHIYSLRARNAWKCLDAH